MATKPKPPSPLDRINAGWANRDLRGATKAVFMVVVTRDGGNGCYATLATIAGDAGITRRTAIRCLNSLVADGYITKTESVIPRRPAMYSLTGKGLQYPLPTPSDTMSPPSDTMSPPSDTMSPITGIEQEEELNPPNPPSTTNPQSGSSKQPTLMTFAEYIANGKRLPTDPTNNDDPGDHPF